MLVFPGVGHLITTERGVSLGLKIMAETNFDEFKGEDCEFVAVWLKPKVYTSFVPYLKVLRTILYYL